MSQVTKAQAVKILWNKGVLKWQLHEVQKKMHEVVNLKIDDKTKKLIPAVDDMFVMLCSRRIGKSHFLCALASEICMQIPGAIIKYACPKQKMVKTIIKPIMRKIFENCPPNLKPEFKTNDNLYEFPNGSQIQLAGTDNGNAETLRGGYSHLWIVDEAGFCTDLAYVVNSILSPTTDTTDGIGILASTPSKHPQHEFITEFVEKWEAEGRLIKYTIYDNPMMTPEKIAKIEKRYLGGRTNPEFRREYLCDLIKDDNESVVPEFDADAEKEIVTDKHERPKLYDWYVSMDIGGKDFTVCLLGYYDFLNSTLVIEDEVVLRNKQNSRTIANELRMKMNDNFPDTKPYLMYADNNNIILLNDLQQQHQLNFIPTQKTDKESQINRVRLMIQNRKIIINPKCKTLIYHLKNVRWARTKTMESYKRFAHGPDGSHYDSVDALLYMVRNIIYSKNPYPNGYGMPSSDNSFRRPDPGGGGGPKGSGANRLFKIVKSHTRKLTNRT